MPRPTRPRASLPPGTLEALHAAAESLRPATVPGVRLLDATPARGDLVLLAGPDATGRAAAAEVLARDAGARLFRVDLAAVSSKYIGETEKNLGRLFDRAVSNGWVLFFDEADALFGKRTEVRDSHDRYANTETNYLLQRLEEHRGVLILGVSDLERVPAAVRERVGRRGVVEVSPPPRPREWRERLMRRLP